MPVSNKPWGEIAESDYADAAQFCNACLMDFNQSGGEKTKGLCFLPYKEPDGTINTNGIQATAGGRGLLRVQKPDGVTPEEFAKQKKQAAAKIAALYQEHLDRPAPASILRVAGKKSKQPMKE